MAKIIATWKSGFGFFHADAQAVADEIIAIGDEATTEQILDKARDATTELHKCFEWDDTIAAEKYRLVQVRYLTSNLVIKRSEEEVKEEKPEIRVFHKTSATGGYKPLQVIIQKQDEYQALLGSAYAELHALKIKYQNLQELDWLLSQIP